MFTDHYKRLEQNLETNSDRQSDHDKHHWMGNGKPQVTQSI